MDAAQFDSFITVNNDKRERVGGFVGMPVPMRRFAFPAVQIVVKIGVARASPAHAVGCGLKEGWVNRVESTNYCALFYSVRSCAMHQG